jgi:hypothetical protein
MRIITLLPLLALSLASSPTSASAQSFCDLLPAATVKAALGLTGNLTAKPDTDGGNGCDYTLDTPGPTTVIADSSDYKGIIKTMFDQRMATLKGTMTKLPGLGDAAYYDFKDHQQIPRFQGTNFTQQSIVFVAKGKLITYIIMTAGPGLPKSAVVSLGTLTISKPIDTLKDPN